MRGRGKIALAMLLALGACASTAGAAPLSMSFTEGRANIGNQLSDDVLFEAPATASFEAEIDPGSGSIAAGFLEIPDFSTHVTDPVVADVTLEFELGEVAGSFDPAAGGLSLEAETFWTLTANGTECAVDTVPPVLELTTSESAGAAPRPGAPFAVGLAGNGAVAGRWDDMTATPVGTGGNAVCNVAEEAIEGPGGLWLEQEGVAPPPPPPPRTDPPPPPPPPPAVCTVPKLTGKTLKAAKRKIRAAGCRVGKVGKAKRRKGQGRFVVKRSNPRAGATPANGKVHLRLGPKLQRTGR